MSNADSGPNTLRQAILNANAAGGAATVQFNLGAGATTIALSSMLPVLTNANGIAIQGTNLGVGGAITVSGGSGSNTTGDRIFFVGVNANDATGLTATANTAFAISNLTL